MKCKECRAVAVCKYVFGRFWSEKSNSGIGCDFPFSDDAVEKIEEIIFRDRHAKNADIKIEQMEIEF